MTVIRPNSIAGITSLTALGNSIDFYNASGAGIQFNNVNLNNTSGLSTFNNINATGVSTLGNVQVSSGIVTATSGVVTYYGDGSKLSNIISGVGIQSAGTVVGTGITVLNFIGAGNTFAVTGNQVDISIQGGGSFDITSSLFL